MKINLKNIFFPKKECFHELEFVKGDYSGHFKCKNCDQTWPEFIGKWNDTNLTELSKNDDIDNLRKMIDRNFIQ